MEQVIVEKITFALIAVAEWLSYRKRGINMADIEIIVKIPEEKYNKFMYSDDVGEEELVAAFEYLANGTPIPDNATNERMVERRK